MAPLMRAAEAVAMSAVSAMYETPVANTFPFAQGDRLLLYTADGESVLAAANQRGARPISSLVRRSTLEDVFLRLTGRTLVD